MGSRYLVTGAQLGMIKGFVNSFDRNPNWTQDIHKVVDEIIDKQFIDKSENNIADDVEKLSSIKDLLIL